LLLIAGTWIIIVICPIMVILSSIRPVFFVHRQVIEDQPKSDCSIHIDGTMLVKCMAAFVALLPKATTRTTRAATAMTRDANLSQCPLAYLVPAPVGFGRKQPRH
jgi:hypothetical protein